LQVNFRKQAQSLYKFINGNLPFKKIVLPHTPWCRPEKQSYSSPNPPQLETNQPTNQKIVSKHFDVLNFMRHVVLEMCLLRVDCKGKIDVLPGVAAAMTGVFPSLLSSVVVAGACWACVFDFLLYVRCWFDSCLPPVAREV